MASRSLLSLEKLWWQHIDISQGELTFWAVQAWLVMAASNLPGFCTSRSCGRSGSSRGAELVIALLMDGPQLKARWGARYAGSWEDNLHFQ